MLARGRGQSMAWKLRTLTILAVLGAALAAAPTTLATSTTWTLDGAHPTLPSIADGGFVRELDQTPEETTSYSLSPGVVRYFATEGSPLVPSFVVQGPWTVTIDFDPSNPPTPTEVTIGRFTADAGGAWHFEPITSTEVLLGEPCTPVSIVVDGQHEIATDEFLTLKLENVGVDSASFFAGNGFCSQLSSPEDGDYVPTPELGALTLSLGGFALVGIALIARRRKAQR